MFNVKIYVQVFSSPTHEKIHTMSNIYDFILKYVELKYTKTENTHLKLNYKNKNEKNNNNFFSFFKYLVVEEC